VVKENQSDQVAGFITFWIIANEFQLHNIAVRWNFRRKGIAARLFLAMIQEALDQGAYTGTLEVRNSNEAARKMYEKFGCRVTTVRSSYYSETKENALIMAVKLKGGLEVLHHE
jgi:ribosomal-protein-alanine N-acetyltransferase